MSLTSSTRYRKNLKLRMHKAQRGCCKYCGRPLELAAATFDHIVPRSLGGKSGVRNLVIACGPCNRKKAHKPPHVWLNELAQGLA